MTRAGKDIEKLIVRHLDGELSADEQLELDRELIRNPEAQRLMEEYTRIDELALGALDRVLGDDHTTFDPTTLPMRGSGRRNSGAFRWHRRVSNLTYVLRYLAPGAVAAALLAIVVARFPLTPSSDTSVAERDLGVAHGVIPAARPTSETDEIMRTVRTGRPGTRIKRSTGREIFGVVGEDGNIYWIEVDRTWTIRRPMRGAASEEL